MALVRCMLQALILPLSQASWAAAISFCAVYLASPAAIASIAVSVFSRLAPLQPAACILAASAGPNALKAAIKSAAPISFLVIVLPRWCDGVGIIAGRRDTL